MVITIGFFRQFIKGYTELDNFIIDAIDWISSDGLAILFTTTVLPRFYRWSEEKGYLESWDIVLRILLILFLLFYVINLKLTKKYLV